MLKTFRLYTGDLLKIALPIIMGNLGFIMIGVGDVIVAGRHSTDTLAAISLATAIINCITIMGIGILCSISPILSNYKGAGKDAEKYFYPSLKFIQRELKLSCINGLRYYKDQSIQRALEKFLNSTDEDIKDATRKALKYIEAHRAE